jgi:DNA-binding protein Fis
LKARLAARDGAQTESVYQALIGFAEEELVAEALELTAGNQVAAAKLLGINRTTLRNKVRGGGGTDD